MRTAIVYDRVNKWGGAERMLLALHEIFPKALLFTSVYNAKTADWAKVFPEVRYSFLQKLPFLRNNHELLGAMTPLAFETFNFDNYDLVISVTSEAAKGIITKPQTIHICICLTPTRYLWSGFNEYQKNVPKSLSWIPFYKLVSKPVLSYAKAWDKTASARPDVYVAISSAVRERIKKYYNRDSVIVYPPVETDRFKQVKRNKTSRKSKFGSNYYLIISRLVPYKKVDLAVEAFNRLGKKLVIAGTGSEESHLKKIAKDNIKFTGFVAEEEIADLYYGATAFIHPQEEDFGITAVEAQAAGVPVIAYNKGGAKDTVIGGRTGIFFQEQTVKSLVEAIKRFEKIRFKKEELTKNADRFSKTRFLKEFRKLVDSLSQTKEA